MQEKWTPIPKEESNGYGGIRRAEAISSLDGTSEDLEDSFPLPDGSHLSPTQRKSLQRVLSSLGIRHLAMAGAVAAAASGLPEALKKIQAGDAPETATYTAPEQEHPTETPAESLPNDLQQIPAQVKVVEMSKQVQDIIEDVVEQAEVPIRTDAPDVRPEARPEHVAQVDRATYERIPVGSKHFLTEVETTRQFITMSQGVQVLNADKEVVGTVPAEEVSGVLPSAAYADSGFVTDGFSGEWLDTVKTVAARELGVGDDSLILNSSVWVDLQNGAEKLGSYPESIAAMTLTFAAAPVEHTGLSRLEYLHTHFHIPNDRMPFRLKDAVEDIALGIPGEESRFDDTVVSSADAHTAFQILPETWEAMEYPPFESFADGVPPYQMQVEAFGRHLGNIYDEIHTAEMIPKLEQIRRQFKNDDDYFTYFMAPLMVNAYNTGAGTMRAAVSTFLEDPVYFDIKGVTVEGYNLFDWVSTVAYEADDGPLARYQEWSRQYTISVMAYAKVLNEGFGNDSYDIAQAE